MVKWGTWKGSRKGVSKKTRQLLDQQRSSQARVPPSVATALPLLVCVGAADTKLYGFVPVCLVDPLGIVRCGFSTLLLEKGEFCLLSKIAPN